MMTKIIIRKIVNYMMILFSGPLNNAGKIFLLKILPATFWIVRISILFNFLPGLKAKI